MVCLRAYTFFTSVELRIAFTPYNFINYIIIQNSTLSIHFIKSEVNPVQALDKYREKIIQNIRSVGTHKDSFANTVDAYARAMMDYDTACESLEKLGSKFMVKHTNKAVRRTL